MMQEVDGGKGFTRRKFLQRSTAIVVTVAASARFVRADPLGRAPGIQLYTVDADLNANVTGTLEALRKIGYAYVETAGFAGLSPGDFRKELDGAGLICPSAHVRFTTADPAPLFEQAHAVGATYAVSSMLVSAVLGGDKNHYLNALDSLTADDFKKTAELANTIGGKARQAGLQYVYHNHNFEFRQLGEGLSGYDILLGNTDMELVKFELDCGWMTAAGLNPVDYLKHYPKRYRLIHVKDFLPGKASTTKLLGSARPVGTELGRGYIDYKPIFQTCKGTGIAYYFSEQEPPIAGMTPLEAARVNYDYMHAL